MATIDELIVRLDADLKPLEAKLKRAAKLLQDFEAAANRSLERASLKLGAGEPGPFTTAQMARLGFPNRPGGPERSRATEARATEVRASGGATVTEVSTTRPAVAAAPILIEIGISVAGSLLADAVKDALQTRDLDIPDQVLKGIEDAFFDPSAAGDVAVEFKTASDELRKAAEESSVAFQRFSNLQFSAEAGQIASAIAEGLEKQLPKTAAKLGDEIDAALASQKTGEVIDPENPTQAELIAQRLSQDLGALKSGQAIDLERFSQQFESLLELVNESQRESLQQLGREVENFAAAVERIRRNELTPEAQERRERALSESERTQTLQLEIPQGLGNACDCIRDLFDRFFGPGGNEPEGDLQTASLVGDSAINGVRRDVKAVEDQAAAWQAVLDRVLAAPPALAQTRRATLDVDRAVRDLGFTFASAFEDAIVKGESLSDILQGLEEDILRILTRLLVTEPLARGLTAGLGSFTGGGLGQGGGLEGLVGGGLGAAANLFPSPVPGVGLGTFNALAPIAAQDVANPLLAGIFQTGGPVHGPGGPRGDRIPALLSDGEFVVNAEAARRHRRLLAVINAGITPPAFATGGRVAPFLRFVGADVSPPRQAAAPEPHREPSFAGRPVVVHIHNPTSVPEIQRGMAQIRGSLREMLARAERRGE